MKQRRKDPDQRIKPDSQAARTGRYNKTERTAGKRDAETIRLPERREQHEQSQGKQLGPGGI